MIRTLAEALVGIIQEGSYPLVFLLMTLESALIPIPSEVVMPFAGFLVQAGRMDYWLAVACGVAGNLVGSLIAYFIGLKIGWEPLKGIPLLEMKIEHAESFMSTYGRWAVFIGRVTPAIRTVISLPAGMSGMNLGEFTILTVLGSIPWNMALVYSGVVLGEHWETVSGYLESATILILLLILVYLVVTLTNRNETRARSHDRKMIKDCEKEKKNKMCFDKLFYLHIKTLFQPSI